MQKKKFQILFINHPLNREQLSTNVPNKCCQKGVCTTSFPQEMPWAYFTLPHTLNYPHTVIIILIVSWSFLDTKRCPRTLFILLSWPQISVVESINYAFSAQKGFDDKWMENNHTLGWSWYTLNPLFEIFPVLSIASLYCLQSQFFKVLEAAIVKHSHVNLSLKDSLSLSIIAW